MSKSAGGTRTTQNGTQSVDSESANWMRQIYGAGQAAGNAGPGPLLNGAGQYGTNAQTQGNLGLSALGGNAQAMQQLMNPYTGQVIDANNQQWQQINRQTANQVNDQATQARAFGGSRQGVAMGEALGQNNMAQAQQNAALLQSGYANAQNQAAQLAQYGFQGAGLNANLGFQGVGSPDLWKLNMLKQGFMGPMGSTSSGRSNTVDTKAGFSIPFFGGK